ncbi:neurofilament heavy polypeptide-like isoform X3 [Rana temporaria]|uniref:neurofilament heavy polypeptide-like isoform X3 n=1 Tax=Rana temporaria TaxID=8407 RepID=UPI001AACDD61|nr:neurofilament heavy polypeptide-like isoform X3 [Rana temporaria]
MVKTPLKVCAFCGQTGGGELGGLQNTTDKSILAHYNCLIFSPLVFTTDDEDDPQFVIASVRAEIKRGKSLKCSYCKQHGATIGCEVKRCQKTYHYECVEKDQGTRDDENYHVYCAKHIQEAKTDSDAPEEETESSKTADEPPTEKENARCSYCKRKGPTIGCVIETCRKTYHIACVEKDEGVLDTVGDDQHVAYCFKHAEKDPASPEGSERSETPDSPSTSYTTSERKTRKSTPGKFSSPRAEKKNAEQDEEWPGSEGQSTSSGTRQLGKRTRSATPRVSSPRAKKRNAIQDTDSSGSSEHPSTSGARSSRTRNRNSDLGDYSPKKTSDAEEVDTSRSSSSSSASDETPARQKMKRKSSPRQIFKQTTKRTRAKKNVKDQQTKSASPVKSKARRGRPPSKKKGQGAASPQKKSKTVASEDEQKSDGDAEGEEMNAQDSGEEMEGVDVRARTAEVESPKRRSTRLSQTIKDTCIPSTSQARFDINESYFTKLYESQCKIANSIESGVSEFRNFAQQFQTSFKQFLDICQSLKHGIGSNITNAHGQITSAEVHHRPDVSPDQLPLSHNNSHSPSSIIDSADDADTNINMLSPEHTPTKEPSIDANDSANDNIDALSENTPTSDGKEPSRDANDSENDVDTNIVTLPSESTPPNDAKGPSQKTNGSASDADIIDTPSPENTPRKTRSSLAGKTKRR